MAIAEFARLLENLIRIGTVAEVRHGLPPRVRVRAGGLDTAWLAWREQRAGDTRTWNPPTIGEQVILLCPGGDLNNGIVLCGLPSDENDTPSHSPTETVTAYPDGAITRYDHSAGALSVLGVQTVVLESAASVKVNCPDTVFDGNVTVKGLFAFENGISGQGGDNGNVIRGNLAHQGGKLSSNGVVLDNHRHGSVQHGGDWTDGPQ